MACLFGHKWNGCKCSKCGKTRSEGHVWHNGQCKGCGIHQPGYVQKSATHTAPAAKTTENKPTPKSAPFKFSVISKYTAFGGVFIEGVMEQGNQLSVGDVVYVYSKQGQGKYENIKVNTIHNENSIPTQTIRAGEGTFKDGLYAAIRLEGVWNVGDFDHDDIISTEKLVLDAPVQENSPSAEKVMPQAKTYNDANRKTHINMATNDIASLCASGSLDSKREWIRDVGQDLYNAHGFDAMQEVFMNVKNRYPASQAKLSSLWDGVGDWAD